MSRSHYKSKSLRKWYGEDLWRKLFSNEPQDLEKAQKSGWSSDKRWVRNKRGVLEHQTIPRPEYLADRRRSMYKLPHNILKDALWTDGRKEYRDSRREWKRVIRDAVDYYWEESRGNSLDFDEVVNSMSDVPDIEDYLYV